MVVVSIITLSSVSCTMALLPGRDTLTDSNGDNGGGSSQPWERSIPGSFDFTLTREVAIEITGDSSYTDTVLVQHFAGDYGFVRLGQGVIKNGQASFTVDLPFDLTLIEIRGLSVASFRRDINLSRETTIIAFDLRNELAPSIQPQLSFSASSFSTQSLGSGGFDWHYQSGSNLRFLAPYDAQGLPQSVENPRPAITFTKALLDDIGANFPEYRPVPQHNPEFIAVNAESNLILMEDAEVSITFIDEGAGYRNTLGYFVFETGAPPQAPPAASEVVVVLPNASRRFSGGDLIPGDRIQLRDPRTGNTVFPSGTTIAWVLIANGYQQSTGTIDESRPTYYSLPGLNYGGNRSHAESAHTVMLFYNKPDKWPEPVLLVGFEDLARDRGDNDFNDLLFSVNATPFTAVDTTDIVVASDAIDSDGDGVYDHLDEYPFDPLRAYRSDWPNREGYATVLVEDLWPSLGDYDFNDAVINLRTTRISNAQGQLVDLIVDLKIRAAGGSLPLGMGLQLAVQDRHVSGVAYEINGVPRQIIGAPGFPTVFALNQKGIEEHGSNVVIPLFDSIHRLLDNGLSAEGEGTAIIINTVSAGISRDAVDLRVVISMDWQNNPRSSIPNTQPFFIVGNRRGHEIHVMNQTPTSLADMGLFGTADDDSEPSLNRWYRDNNGAPWVLVIPEQVPWPREKTNIAQAYPRFGDWVSSGGQTNGDWYRNLSGRRNGSFLY